MDSVRQFEERISTDNRICFLRITRKIANIWTGLQYIEYVDGVHKIESSFEVEAEWFDDDVVLDPQYINFKKEKSRKADFSQTPENLSKVLLRLLQRIQTLENAANGTTIVPPAWFGASNCLPTQRF